MRFGRVGIVATAVALVGLATSSAASAADTIYWNNYEGGSLSFSSLDGTGGGIFNSAGAEVIHPEGTTIDSATGRLYWSSPGTEVPGAETGAIFSAALDGSGGGQMLNTTGATVVAPLGVVVDPVNGTLYWSNDEGGTSGSIGYAKLDGSGGGILNTSGAEVDNPGPITLDLAAGRVYWGNYSGEEKISYANLDGSGGGNLDTTGAPDLEGTTGLAIDPTSTRIYYVGETTIDYANLSGGGGGELNVAGATYDDPYGLAIDPATNSIYWTNEENGTNPEGALAYASLSGLGGASLNPTAPVNHPQDPVIQSAPAGTAAPTVSGAATPGSVLSCSTGSWAADLAGGFFYQAPTSYGYQWNLNGAAIGGATGSTYTAAGAGSYTCTVTASDQAGSSNQTSSAFTVAATLRFKKIKRNLKKGTATILAQVSGPGKLSLSGKKIVGAKGRSSGAQVVKLTVKAKGKAKKALAKKGKVKVQAKVVFAPSGGGSAVSKAKGILLKKKLG
jgi:hypothetical protein